MLLSRNWLENYVNVEDLSDDQIAGTLTDLGLEVEGKESVPPLHEKIVVGKITSAKPHPNADTLQICDVDIGSDEKLSIVCGAPNARKDIYVCVAQIGSILPGNFKIKPTKIRGEKSQGMLCSEKELEVSSEHEGIAEISSDFELGKKISEIFKTEDSIFEISITPNRGDCLGYLGIARDLAAKLKREVNLPKPCDPSYHAADLTTADNVNIEIQDQEASQRFVALYIQNVSIVPSPSWIQKRLEASGMRPINLIVDVTNYVMLEMNHPIHAYDERHVTGNKIIVRRARANDQLTTLDGNEIKLNESDILICDSEKPIGLAGIMGGENSEVRDDTKNIIVEVAEFDPGQIRKTSKRVSLHTEASHRFERGCDYSAIPKVARRVGDLILECSKELGLNIPKISKDLVDVNFGTPSPKIIALKVDRAKKLLGLVSLTKETCIEHLEALKFRLVDQKEDRLLFEIPSWRNDIVSSIDLIEEIGRLVGFDKIPYKLPKMNIRPNDENPYINFTETAKLALASSGLTEVILYPFVSGKQYNNMLISRAHPYYPSVELINPLSEEFNLLQTSQLAPMLTSTLNNRNKGARGSRMFQVGRGYLDSRCHDIPDKFQSLRQIHRPSHHLTKKAKSEKNRPTERHFLSIVLDYPFTSSNWNVEERSPHFFDMKNICEKFFKTFGLVGFQYLPVNEDEFPFVHPKKSATIWKNDVFIGVLGELHPEGSMNIGLGIQQIPVICEIEIESLYDITSKQSHEISEQCSFPPALRDIALLVPEHVTHADFEAALSSFKRRKFLTKMSLFDVYQGQNVKSGYKSMAYSLALRSSKQTLKDAQIEKETGAFINHLRETLGAEQR